MIGSGLFSSPALCGALCYAELGTMLPMNGGETPGRLAIICIVFGEYVSRIAYHTYYFNVPHDSDASVELADAIIPKFLPKLLAVACLLILTLINAISIPAGIRLQDILTIFKVLTAVVISVMGVVVLSNKGIIAGGNSIEGDPFKGLNSISFGQFALAFYSANVAYLAVLKPEVIIHTNTVSMDFGKKMFGPAGGILFAICVALSCFGSANADVFTGARIIYVSAKQGHIPGFFGKLSQSRQTPILALILQAVLTVVMIMIGSFRVLIKFLFNEFMDVK
ncbi:hypothetical protein RO3G_17121 [Rhizopus delemar RA 99-880]|uniref:Amino acid permease/ SLC12A domain-containing protein n=1 Tax=Rhizopus delemar (strain RA 99-880 / ATCC MYA-4621 / FGSC 9543 / NRRL 43880) TaxID=246409 RepID=I1CVP3_RHIO9|nr:hypothetical protein RO3G_17121 [Rhizopus delemar RA 99-880]|eukprot:EIE92523.1 hypothetical protein RO3G_17121 [Rhizopus delemar RA 99-880]